MRNCSLRAISPFPTLFFRKLVFLGASKGVIVWEWVNYLPYDKILTQSKLKALADDKINATQKMKFMSERVENILGKGENAG